MNSHILFAVSQTDAQAACEQLGIKFSETVWVMNRQLLGDLDLVDKLVHVTEAFRRVPAFREVAPLIGETVE